MDGEGVKLNAVGFYIKWNPKIREFSNVKFSRIQTKCYRRKAGDKVRK